jgi:hypothetical protein
MIGSWRQSPGWRARLQPVYREKTGKKQGIPEKSGPEMTGSTRIINAIPVTCAKAINGRRREVRDLTTGKAAADFGGTSECGLTGRPSGTPVRTGIGIAIARDRDRSSLTFGEEGVKHEHPETCQAADLRLSGHPRSMTAVPFAVPLRPDSRQPALQDFIGDAGQAVAGDASCGFSPRSTIVALAKCERLV